ncbi:hypothetical protein Pint_26151 [Pistacia integerrima]|uniref:Uncharacterized protein n=2 Tax=Pistacia integerrima TaxID=434235 RepID=A0ACC0YII8_9ROSI|nr:hypothetical protein Pint_26155 [Pistacia integerrima]KAJ0035951.1 hypothetical protein Pint_26151 [Pistacia integerrima]
MVYKFVNGNAINLIDKSDHVVNLAEKSDHAKVKETLRLFNKHYLHFVQVGFTISTLHIIFFCLVWF